MRGSTEVCVLAYYERKFHFFLVFFIIVFLAWTAALILYPLNYSLFAKLVGVSEITLDDHVESQKHENVINIQK